MQPGIGRFSYLVLSHIIDHRDPIAAMLWFCPNGDPPALLVVHMSAPPRNPGKGAVPDAIWIKLKNYILSNLNLRL